MLPSKCKKEGRFFSAGKPNKSKHLPNSIGTSLPFLFYWEYVLPCVVQFRNRQMQQRTLSGESPALLAPVCFPPVRSVAALPVPTLLWWEERIILDTEHHIYLITIFCKELETVHEVAHNSRVRGIGNAGISVTYPADNSPGRIGDHFVGTLDYLFGEGFGARHLFLISLLEVHQRGKVHSFLRWRHQSPETFPLICARAQRGGHAFLHILDGFPIAPGMGMDWADSLTDLSQQD